MEVRPGYKQTEVGVIPEDWQAKSLASLGSFSKGQGIRKNEAASGNLPCIRYGEIYTHHHDIVCNFNSFISPQVARTSRRLSKGDVLFAGSGETKEEIGKAVAYLGDDEAYAGGDIVILSPRGESPEFLGYQLNSPVAVRQKSSKGQGDAVVHINARALGAIVVPLPPLLEQRAIAAALSDVDALLSGLDRLIAKKRNLKQAAMQQLLTGQTRLPGFHGEWEKKRLGDLAEIVSGGTPRTNEPSYWNGGIKWCTPTDITRYAGKYLTETERTISRDGLDNSGAALLPIGALLLCSRATIGEVKIAAVPICTNQGFKSLVCRPATSIEFLYYKLLTMKQQMMERAFGSTFLEISTRNVHALAVAAPSPEEQTAIATVLSDIDTELAALEARRDKTRALKQAMMQELLTGRTRLV